MLFYGLESLMSVIADTRQVIQDLLAPEIASLKERLSALENKVDENEKHAGNRHHEVLTRMQSDKDDVLRAIARIEDVNSIRERLTRLETRKEIGQESRAYETAEGTRRPPAMER
jgi:hypothetical protein